MSRIFLPSSVAKRPPFESEENRSSYVSLTFRTCTTEVSVTSILNGTINVQ